MDDRERADRMTNGFLCATACNLVLGMLVVCMVVLAPSRRDWPDVAGGAAFVVLLMAYLREYARAQEGAVYKRVLGDLRDYTAAGGTFAAWQAERLPVLLRELVGGVGAASKKGD